MRFLIAYFALLLSFFSAGKAEAIILYGKGNDENLSPPSGSEKLEALPFYSVVRVFTSGVNYGSAVYLGNGFFITANHVKTDPSSSAVSLDGKTLYPVAPYFTHVRIADKVDAKIFYVDSTSGILSKLTSASIYSSALFSGQQFYVVSGGLGRDNQTPVGSAVVPWGDYSTLAIRWGTNLVSSRGTIADQTGENSYSGYVATLDSDAGDDEASLAEMDSGGGMFYYNQIFRRWYLAGIATGVSASDKSSFSDGETEGDNNIYLNLSAYRSQISAVTSQIPSGFEVFAYQNMPNSSAEDRAPEASPYSDGFSNLEKYALGLPMDRAASLADIPLFKVGVYNGTAKLSFPLRISANDVSVKVLVSRDLTNWTETEAAKVSETESFGLWEAGVETSAKYPVFFKLEISKATNL